MPASAFRFKIIYSVVERALLNGLLHLRSMACIHQISVGSSGDIFDILIMPVPQEFFLGDAM